MKTLKELLRSKVGRKQPVVFAFGRLNPPTIGHQKLIDKVITIAKDIKYINEIVNYLILSETLSQ